MAPRLPSFLFVLPLSLLFSSIAFAQQFAPTPLITQPVLESHLTTLRGNTHPLARPQFDVGAAPPDLPMNRMLLVLKRSAAQEHALITMLDNQHDKLSPQYHKWLTPDEFGVQFGPSDQDMQTITGWLQSHGFQINRISKGRSVIEFSGYESQVEAAFHTAIHKYLVNGEEHWANANDPQIPPALAPAVAGVWTLHNLYKKPQVQYSATPVAFTRGPSGEVTFPNPGSPDIHALGPQDYATIYNINPVYQAGITGQKTTIAVVGRAQLDLSDVTEFFSLFGCPAGCPSVQILDDGPPPMASPDPSEQLEATLDATWSGAIAPGAIVDFVASASTNTTDGVDLSELYIVDNDIGSVMTESFGSCEAAYTAAEAQGISSLAEQASAEGITYLVSAGDTGAAGCDSQGETIAQGPVSVNVLASSAYTVAVGGTMFNEGGNDSKYWSNNYQALETALSYIPENVWNESCTVSQCGQNSANILAGGGGASTIFAKPSWQSPSLWPSLNIPNDGFRDVPDVSLTAAGHDPYLLCVFGSCSNNFIYFVYGTSASAPSFAGIMALVNQKLQSPQGQADYVLYSLANKENYSQCNGSGGLSAGNTCVFNDVTIGNNAVPGEASFGTSTPQFAAGPAYDLATGLGSVNVANLLNGWFSATFNASTTSLTMNSGNPVTVAHGTAVPFAVNVSGNSGTPSGDISLIANIFTANLGFFTLSNGSVNSQTDALPGGTYTLYARYAGDGTFGPSTSQTTSVTVTPETTSITLSALTPTGGFPAQLYPGIPMTTFTSGPYGSYVYMTSNVTGKSGVGTPTGQVYFSDSGTGGFSSGPVGMNSQGNASVPTFTLNPGTHSFTAQYLGDASFNSTPASSPSQITISQAPTNVVVTYAGASSGASFTATVTSNSAGNPPTGSVSFSVNGTQFQPSALFSNTYTFDPQTGAFIGAQGTATFGDAQLPNGQATVTATYSGDGNYLGSTSPSTPINLQPDFSVQPSTTSLQIQTPGQSASMNLAMTDLDGFTGTVTFSCAGLPSESQCAFTPGSLTTTGSTNLVVSTTAKTALLKRRDSKVGWSLAWLMFGTFGICLGFPEKRRRRKLWLTIFLALVCFGCGGGANSGGGGGGGGGGSGQSNPGTPPGAYAITVTGTSGSGSSAISHSATFTLLIQ